MLLLLDEDHKNHLEPLRSLPVENLKEMVKWALNSINNDSTPEAIEPIASSLNIESEMLKQCVDGLAYFLVESSRLVISDIDFHDSMMALGLSENHCKVLVDAYMENRVEIRKMLQTLTLQPVQYHDLEWRLNVRLASRCTRGQITPNVLMRLHTQQGDDRQSTLLDCDIPNLVNLANTLEQALDEAKSQYTRRILRNIK